jgi:hypothetical protein
MMHEEVPDPDSKAFNKMHYSRYFHSIFFPTEDESLCSVPYRYKAI